MNCAETDLLLLFPGVTEARHFPYLSLPMLTSFCREQGLTVVQHDLNIELAHTLLSSAFCTEKLQADGGHKVPALRRALFSFLAENQITFPRPPRSDAGAGLTPQVAVRIALTAIEAGLADSLLVDPCLDMDQLIARATRTPAGSDLATHAHDRLTAAAVHGCRPKVVGFSVAFYSQLLPTLRSAHLVRELLPDALIVLGGQQVMLRGEDLAAVPGIFDLVDLLAVSAGEHVLPAAVCAAAGQATLESISDVISRGGRHPAARGGHHIRDNPAPAFDGLPFDRYIADVQQLPAISCIGCYWGRCTYCSYGNRSLRTGYQQLSSRQIADIVEDGLQNTEAKRVTFVDENSNLRVLVRTMELIRSRGHGVVWSTRNRLEPELTDLVFCQRLADSGCVLMSVGYETNSQRLLDAVDKGIKADTYQSIVDNLHAAGIGLRFSIMGGLPSETKRESDASREFLLRNAEKIGIDVTQMLVVEPTTLLAAAPGDAGLTVSSRRRLANNTGFSYLGGRTGWSFEYDGPTQRADRIKWLRQIVDDVLPGKNAELHPRFRHVGSLRPAMSIRLYDWIVRDPGSQGRSVFDLRWTLTYRLPPDVVWTSQTTLRALTSAGEVVLGLLVQAEAGVAEQSADGLAG